ncbi:MAG: FAD-dependent oxidoreductase [Acidimicrobiia bacterium]|nr:FAD-dependent oxidoreductase [Acidimicrobiia bacterium]
MADDLFDFDADVLVVGTGGAGFAAAITAAVEGASVVMFERNDHIGGTTGASGGTAWIPNNRSLREQGKQDPRDDALRYMCKMSHPQYYYADHPTLGLPADAYELIANHYDSGSVAIDYLTEAGVLDLTADTRAPDPDNPMEMPSGNLLQGFPDYGADLEEDKLPTGRHLFPTPGTPGMVEQFELGAAKYGVQIVLEHQAMTLLRNDEGEVAGLQLRRGHEAVLARARKAVIFASGGYAHSAELIERYLPGRIYGTCSTLGAQGDFVRIGLEVGAALGNMKNAWWKQVPLEAALVSPTPPSVWLPWGDSMIHVNKYGKRVVNEKMGYSDRSQIHFTYDPSEREYPNLLLFMIYDDAVASSDSMDGMRQPLPMPGEADPGFVIKGETWDELAAKIDARLAEHEEHTAGLRLDASFSENLAATIERFNGFAATGEDLDFHRGEGPINRAWNGPNREGSPNPTLAPFAEKGPYRCIIVGAGMLDTNGGPVINTSAQVLDGHGTPIPGLYGAGNCIASPAGQAYWGPGATIGLGITYGHLAGRAAAAEPEKRFDV